MGQTAGAGISGARLAELAALLSAGQEYKFYSWPEWRGLRAEVLRLDQYCQVQVPLNHQLLQQLCFV